MKPARPRTNYQTSNELTPREREVIGLAHLTNRAIAKRLHRSIHTVKNHMHAALEKLGVATRQEAMARIKTGGELCQYAMPGAGFSRSSSEA